MANKVTGKLNGIEKKKIFAVTKSQAKDILEISIGIDGSGA